MARAELESSKNGMWSVKGVEASLRIMPPRGVYIVPIAQKGKARRDEVLMQGIQEGLSPAANVCPFGAVAQGLGRQPRRASGEVAWAETEGWLGPEPSAPGQTAEALKALGHRGDKHNEARQPHQTKG